MLTALAIIILCFGLGAIFGAPFLPARKVDVEASLDMTDLKAGDTIIDLGSGDGRLLIAAAKRGINAIGYEINPLLFVWSLLLTLPYRKRVRVRLSNFWIARLPQADAIYTFLIGHHTEKLDKKLKKELTAKTKVISYVFELPRKPVKQSQNTFLYIYP